MYVCILFVVHCKNRVGSLVVHHPVHVIFGGGARRKQFMTKGGGVGEGRSAPLTMILSSFLKEVSLRGSFVAKHDFLHMSNLYGCRKYCFDSLHRSLQET